MLNRELRICVLGGTGFIGSRLVIRLAEQRHWVRVPTRSLAHGAELRVLPTVELIRANIHEPRILSELFQDIDVVINLVGVLNNPLFGGHGLRSAHVELASKVVSAARAERVPRLLHMSALGANAESGPSEYLRTKGEAEKRVIEAGAHLKYTIFRPSVVFGPGDSLTNRFARLLRLSHGFMPLARAKARFAPIYVEDVVEAFVRSLRNHSTVGNTYELCGPDVMTLEDIVRLTAKAAGLRCWILPLPDFIARLQGLVMGLLPGRPFTLDNFKSLTVDNVCNENGCAKLGIRPQSMEAILPMYLGSARYRYHLA